jgi:membrane associated rhomboid family serine protease
MNSFVDEIKFELRNKMFMKLVVINVLVYLVIQLVEVFFRLTNTDFSSLFVNLFTLKTSFSEFIFSPWGIITSQFSHFDFFHLFFNMIFLYFSGKIAEYHFGSKSLLIIYLTGGVFGGIIEIIFHFLFPTLQLINSNIVGASGSIMAVFIAVAVSKPKTEVSIYGLINVKIIWLALIYFLGDLINIGSNDGIAHLTHIGGAIMGFILANNHGKNLGKLNQLFNSNKTHLSVKKGGRPLSDDEFNHRKKENEEITNQILDKISKSGYESLSKSEKEFLFKQSKNG